MASSLVNGVPYKIFICLKSVDLPDSPAPKIRSLILRDSAAQLWVSERESCGWGLGDGAVVDGVARRWRDAGRVDGVGRSWHIAARARAKKTARARARVRRNDAVAYLAVALAPAAVVFLDGRAAAHCFVPPGCCFGGARARSRFFAARRLSVDVSRLLLASAAPAGPRRGRQDAQGAAQAGAKHSGDFPPARPRQASFASCVGVAGRARACSVSLLVA